MNKYNGKTFLVTGALGHIGSYIVEEICRQFKDCTVVCVDNMYNGNPDNLIEARKWARKNHNNIALDFSDPEIVGDQCVSITDYPIMEMLFREYKPNYVFHEASMLTLDSKLHKQRAIEVNVLGSSMVFDLSLKHKVEKVVYASSASVYGDPQYTPTDENHPKECSLLYGATKIAVEALADSFVKEEGMDIVGLRYFNVYGSRQSTANVYTQIVPKWIQSMIRGEPIHIYGDGSQTMDMIHGSDIGKIKIKALEAPRGFYNVASGIETSVMDLYKTLYRMMNSLTYIDPVRSEIIYEDHDPALVKKRCADVINMHKYLGKHEVSVEKGIEEAIREAIK